MEHKNCEKNQKFLVLLMTNVFFCLLTLNSRADIITRHNFNQVRCFFTVSMDVCTGYFLGFTFLKNVVLLVKTTSLSGSFYFIKVSIIRTFWFLLENATKNSPPEAVSEDWSQSAREILWWNSYYSKFGWLGILGISLFM